MLAPSHPTAFTNGSPPSCLGCFGGIEGLPVRLSIPFLRRNPYLHLYNPHVNTPFHKFTHSFVVGVFRTAADTGAEPMTPDTPQNVLLKATDKGNTHDTTPLLRPCSLAQPASSVKRLASPPQRQSTRIRDNDSRHQDLCHSHDSGR